MLNFIYFLMYIDSSNHFGCFIHDFLFGKFWLVLFQHGTWDIFVNYFVVQWRLSSTIALCLWGFFWSKDCSRKKTLLIVAVNKTYWKWHDCVWLSLAAPVAVCSRPACSLWQYTCFIFFLRIISRYFPLANNTLFHSWSAILTVLPSP